MTVMDTEDPALPGDIDEVEAVVACLGDDAALLRQQNPECEIAANMEAAAQLLEKLRAGNAEMAQRALDLADRSMFDLLESEAIAHDEYRTVLGLTNEGQQEVASLAEASEAMQEAVQWLRERGYVEIAEDPSGEYVNVLRRPGEDDNEDMEP